MEFTITSSDILWILGFVISLWGVVKIYKEWKRPSDDLKEQVKKNTEHLAADNIRLKQIEEDNKIICKALMVLINHGVTGNGIENMKEVRDELQSYLINR